MLDNFATADVVEGVRRARGKALVEVSGGITLERVAELASAGVDVISVGALTHSAPAADIGLDLERLGADAALRRASASPRSQPQRGLALGHAAGLPSKSTGSTNDDALAAAAQRRTPTARPSSPRRRRAVAAGAVAPGARPPGENLLFSVLLRPKLAPGTRERAHARGRARGT